MLTLLDSQEQSTYLAPAFVSFFDPLTEAARLC